MEILTGLPRLLDAVVFMAPNDQVKKGIKERFRQVVGGASLSPVLMHYHHVEPLRHGLLWPQHFDLRKGVTDTQEQP